MGVGELGTFIIQRMENNCCHPFSILGKCLCALAVSSKNTTVKKQNENMMLFEVHLPLYLLKAVKG